MVTLTSHSYIVTFLFALDRNRGEVRGHTVHQRSRHRRQEYEGAGSDPHHSPDLPGGAGGGGEAGCWR